MFCPKCGANNTHDGSFCVNCGAPLPGKSGLESSAAPYFSPSPVFQRKPRFTPRYAGFWIRFVAYLVDCLLLMPMHLVLNLLVGIAAAGAVSASTSDEEAAGAVLVLGMAYWFWYFVLYWLYEAVFTASSLQATPGKRLLGLKVTDLNGNRISFGRATGRFLGKILSSLIFCLGFIRIGFSEKKRGWHDELAGTYVVYR